MTAQSALKNDINTVLPEAQDLKLSKEEFKKELADKIELLTKSGKWEDFKKFSQSMYKYSFSNQIWLFVQGLKQGIEISRVAAASAWKKLGRWPKKGSKSLRVLAPLMRKIEDKDTGEKRQIIFGFKLVPVFDVSQTEGKDLPDTDLYKPLAEGFNQNIWDALIDYAGYPVIVEDLNNSAVGGYWSPKEKHIKINSVNPKAFQMAVLVHEITHAKDDHKKSDQNTETIAEGVAYMVMTHYGLNMEECSIPYLASWTKGDTSFIQLHGDTIYKIGKDFIAHINKSMKLVDPLEEAAEQAKEDYANKPKKKKPTTKKKTIKA